MDIHWKILRQEMFWESEGDLKMYVDNLNIQNVRSDTDFLRADPGREESFSVK